ncbi:MAG: very short patch repair endonuclease [Enterobacteriaceae bacterium]
MADVHNPKVRRKNMQAIRTRDTAIEIKLATLLDEMGLKFRTQVKELAGKPDFVIDEHRKIIFTHGCFWHRHDCYLFKVPGTRTEFWMEKIGQNVLRDKKVYQQLIDEQWHVMIIWECALKGRLRLSTEALAERIEEWIFAGNGVVEIDTDGIRGLY